MTSTVTIGSQHSNQFSFKAVFPYMKPALVSPLLSLYPTGVSQLPIQELFASLILSGGLSRGEAVLSLPPKRDSRQLNSIKVPFH